MLDVKLIRDNPDEVKAGVGKKGTPPQAVDAFLAADEGWRALTRELDMARAEHKKFSEVRNVERARELKAKEKDIEEKIRSAEAARSDALVSLPNIPLRDVPEGKGDESNKVLREVGEKPSWDFPAENYLALAEQHDLIDTARAGKVAGTRFGYLKNEAAMLEFALVSHALKTLVPAGFSPIVPPVLVRPEILHGMGKTQFIKDDDAFYIEKDKLFLVGSSEHSIGPQYMDETLDPKDLPKRFVGFSTCFRREAGSYGKDTKGILRVHQFDKVEMFVYSKPEESEQEHQFLLGMQEKLMQDLGLPYRVVEVCAGEMTWGDARQYDIETWIPSEGRYRETQSCSNTTDFQSRGLNIKYRMGGKTEFVHTLNATAYAIGRMVIAIMENFQTKDGAIRVPRALAEYVGKELIG